MLKTDPQYQPHWLDGRGIVHVGNFTGPFTACGRSHVGMAWRDPNLTPPTCVECVDYISRKM